MISFRPAASSTSSSTQGLEHEEIYLGARIVAVCDVFEGVTSKRPYRGPMKPKEVIALLEEEAGPKLDAECVEAFLKIYREADYKKGEVGRRRSGDPTRSPSPRAAS